MGEFAAPGAYEVLATSLQRDRLFNVDLDSGLGRKPTPVPAHLSRVLYVPRHSMLNLSLFDAGLQYKQAVDHSPVGGEEVTGKALMGSRLFKTRVNTMIRDGGDISATVHKGGQADPIPHVNILLSVTSDQHSDTINISTTYPLPRLESMVAALHFPYSRFSIPNTASVYEWQIHPLDHGTLRYTLAELGGETCQGETDSGPQDSNIKAIYHHIGHHGSLFLPHSEGVLLLPETANEHDGWLELVIVSSLIGLLWRIRGMEIKDDEPQAASVKKRPSLMKRVFGRKQEQWCSLLSTITTSGPDSDLDDTDTRLPIMPLLPTSNESGELSGNST
ncbi:hypothetical protein MAC_01992 [Metarhizium acridum CQMa 102]|uniref:Uncharacterized protein n=1 Tax=Metarhizium acridum (strain CQMa 102) TaxID=655827 RepID=E9DWJ4_METAQ|nr:uncharacterized protein MAC_01992 [Metarhizium acridum CQMa 102]EFY92044.1 hypothetical protein MAC_01992 [Metarhizium acridum CQMa 102]